MGNKKRSALLKSDNSRTCDKMILYCNNWESENENRSWIGESNGSCLLEDVGYSFKQAANSRLPALSKGQGDTPTGLIKRRVVIPIIEGMRIIGFIVEGVTSSRKGNRSIE